MNIRSFARIEAMYINPTAPGPPTAIDYWIWVAGHVPAVRKFMTIFSAVWLVLLLVSPKWLREFRFGPAEWLWRSMTYASLQPIRRVTIAVSRPA